MQTLPVPGLGGSVPLGPLAGESRTEPEPTRRTRHWVSGQLAALRGPDGPARIVTLVVLAGVTAFVVAQLQLGLVFSNTLDVGGDNAAHVVAPYYLIHSLLPHGQISGWDPQWFDGYPLYVFYFPLPALIIAFFTWFAPYAVAFKLVTILGTVFLPIAAYGFGRGAGLRRPIPVLMSIATVPFLFNPSYTINGGNVFSTMAGEFSFSLSLTFALAFLGVFCFALRTGRLRWLAALLFTATVLCHVVPALFAAVFALVLALFSWNLLALKVALTVGLAGALLSAFWLVPFKVYLAYSSSMNFGPVGGSFLSNVAPHTGELAVLFLAGVGTLLALWKRERVALAIAIAAIGSAAAFWRLPSGLVYDGRWLPFWFLTTSLLAAYAVAELGRLAFNAMDLPTLNSLFTPLVAGSTTVVLFASWLGVLPFANISIVHRNLADNWTKFNYAGYQAKPGWPELERIVAMLDQAGKTYGCGRLDYEYTPNVSTYFGSTLFEMSFPLFTNGCIDTAEGVYYESSTTTHFHFLDQSELGLAGQVSNPVAGLPYENLSVIDGVKHLQLEGVQYFLANSPTVEAQAAADPSLEEIASTPATPSIIDGAATTPLNVKTSWILYKIRDVPLVVPLDYDPVVESGLSVTALNSVALVWYQQKQYWQVPIAATGPASWPRRPLGELIPPSYTHAVVPTTVSHVRSTDESISFDVGRLGSPVLVKIPYFPNWQASGATGPYLVTPNLMVVVPTAHHVVLTYGTTSVDWFGRELSIVGVGALLGLTVRPASGVGPAVSDAPRDPEAEGGPQAPSDPEPLGEPEPEPGRPGDSESETDGPNREGPASGAGEREEA